MSGSAVGSFARISIVIALLSGALVAVVAAPRGEPVLLWSLLGWLIMALIGVVAGVWMVRVHGRPGSGFLMALGTGMLARLFISAAGALAAAQQGVDIVYAYLAGLFTGYLPLQVFEVTWFFRRARSQG